MANWYITTEPGVEGVSWWTRNDPSVTGIYTWGGDATGTPLVF